ncbi:MAG: hypothetical protein HOZ81_30155, partial [Streptomyces sp.]|nr:hypothetical protein [Streptomyces sp.]
CPGCCPGGRGRPGGSPASWPVRPTRPCVTAYRIVQEALTNVTKHAGDREARVRLSYGDERLVLAVSDDGRARRRVGMPANSLSANGGSTSGSSTSGGSTRGGYGLIGMRERARSVGGRIRTGPRPEGGFEVVAELPYPPGPR